MKKFDFDNEYFNPKDVLECGQVFRFEPYEKGYKAYSRDKACYVYTEGNKTVVESDYPDYFYNYFDLNRDYRAVTERIKEYGVPVLTHSVEACKGLRLLKQDKEETLFSFIISQNNNIPRIKGIISRICAGLGEKKEFMGMEYYSFPAASVLATKDPAYYKSLGLGYRDVFIYETAKRITEEGISHLDNLGGDQLKKALLGYKGVGPKVADCVCLFGYGQAASFPVDTWIEKIYREDFGGTEKNREKINKYFTELFGEYSGLVQQYLFYGKRAHL